MTLSYRIEPDEDAQDPRTDRTQYATLACWRRGYDLGDEQPSDEPEVWLRNLACEFDSTLEDRIERAYSRSRANKIAQAAHHYWDTQEYKDAVKEYAELENRLIRRVLNRHAMIVPLFLYDHSGISMRTAPFHDPWDSGQVGYALITPEKVRECGFESGNWRKHGRTIIEQEVAEYDQYLTGDVYGYVVESDVVGELDSCWGFYGYTYCEDEAKSVLAHYQTQDAEGIGESLFI